MGKVKNRNRRKKSKPFLTNGNHTDNNEGNGVAPAEEDEFSRVMSDIVDKLESLTVMEKLSALLLLSEMVDLKQIRSIIIEHEICKIVGPLLLDSDIQVCLNAAGAIRNLTSCGEEEVLEALVEQDVLTPVLTLLRNLSQTLQKPESLNTSMEVDGAKAKKGAKAESVEWEEKIELACQVVNTLWNLCESCATVLKYVNNEEVMSVFIRFLDVNKYDISLAIVSAQFIHMLSEDNNFVIKYLIQHENLFETGFQSRQQDIDPQDLNGSAVLLQVLYAGILQNIQPNFFTKDARTLATLSNILSTNQRLVLNQLTSELPKSSDKLGKLRITSVTNFISAQKLILEFITNLCSSDEDEDTTSCGMDVDMSDGEDETVSPGGTKLSPELQARFEEYNIVQVVLEKVELPAVNVCAILRGEDDYKHLMDKIIKLQCTGFLCINNLVSCLDIPAETLFTEFVKILRHHYNDDLSEEQSESLTCALRSLVLSLDATLQGVPQVNDQGHPVLVALEKGNLSGGNAVLPDEFLNSISKLLVAKLTGEEGLKNGGSKGQKLKSGGEGDKKEVGVKVKENLVKVVATWTTILLRMKRPNSTEHDTFVLSNLLHFLDNTEDLILLAETLDCLIDLFSDDDTDVLAKQVNLTGKLTANEPKLKSMIKSNKKTLDSEKLALVSTVQTNLHAFIQYKRQRVANVK